MKLSLFILLALATTMLGEAARAQSNIIPAHTQAWGENVGWMNFRDAGATNGAQGVRVGATFLSGYTWDENIGFVNFGNTAPANGVAYANPTSGLIRTVPDFGVNRDPASGALSGYAWSENAGWINFSGGALATPANPATFDAAAHRFRGYAWGENVGWLNLDDPTSFVAACQADFNGDGNVSVQDIFDFLSAWFSTDPRADFNGSGVVTVQDIFDFLAAWFAKCAV